MRATQLIHQLAELVAKHGDLPVTAGYFNHAGQYVIRHIDGFAAYDNDGEGVPIASQDDLTNFGALLGSKLDGTQERSK